MGETDLNKILENLEPEIAEGEYYFASVDESQLMSLAGYLDYIIAIVKEKEGLTIVFLAEIKDDLSDLAQDKISGPFSLISLGVNSDLMAIGLLAKITAEFERAGISVNAFSGYYHDHFFVPSSKKDLALQSLKLMKSTR